MSDRAQQLQAARDEARRWQAQSISEVTPSRRDFAQYVTTQRQGLAVIARINSRTPPPLAAAARRYDDAEVAALAVDTGPGELQLRDMKSVADATTAPILRDDFVIEPAQIYASRLHGADGIVVPLDAVGDDALREIAAVAASLHMAVVLGVTAMEHIERAVRTAHAIIGIHAASLAGWSLPAQRTIVGLSEAASWADAERLRGRCDAIIAGPALLADDALSERVAQLAAG